MIGDAQSIESNSILHTNICIVGGGAAGITLALELIESKHSVVLLEAGNMASDAATQSLYEGEVAAPSLHSPTDTYRRRRFGGSTTVWGGRCVPLDPIDLEERGWIPNSGWPIDYNQLSAHYPTANRICEAGRFSYKASDGVVGGMRHIIRGFEPNGFDSNCIERFSRPTDFGARYHNDLAASSNLRVFMNANCTQLSMSADGSRVQCVAVKTLRGNSFSVRANCVVLAVGGLEIPRLLLNSRDVHHSGVGNAGGLVGRYYMCHIAGTIGSLRLSAPKKDIWHGYERDRDGTYCRRRFALTAEEQRTQGIGNIVFRLHHPPVPDPTHRTGSLSLLFLARHLISYEYASRLRSETAIGVLGHILHARNIVTDPIDTTRFIWRMLRWRRFSERKFPSIVAMPRNGIFSIDFHAEQVPNHASQVRLSPLRDPLGQHRILVDWRYTDADVHTLATGFNLLRKGFASSGRGVLEFSDEAADFEGVIRRNGAYGGHHIGTARMAHSARTGVVDSNCRVFGVNNLYIAGSAVFPTSGQANPTLTIVALAVRLARHLRERPYSLVNGVSQGGSSVPSSISLS